MKKALIVVDYQYDFANPKGSLYTKDAEKLEPLIMSKITEYKNSGNFVIFSKDWHPKNHISFKQWPAHTIKNTLGSECIISQSFADLVIEKGDCLDQDSYSAFYLYGKKKSILNSFLIKNDIIDLEICGLIKDVCVKATYEDAKKFHFNAFINPDLTK